MEHNCVIVPRFGAFIGNYRSAQLNRLSNKLSPPSKLITFNPKLSQNDGLLINYVAEQNGMGYAEAEEIVKREVTRWKEILRNAETVTLPKVGSLFTDSTGVIRFERDEQFNLLKSSYGLEPFFLREVSRPLISEENKPLQDEATPAEAPVIPISRNQKKDWKKVAIAAALLPFIGYLIYLPTQTNLLKKAPFHASELNPFSDKICEVYQPRKVEAPVVSIPAEEQSVSLPSDERYIYYSLFLPSEKEGELPKKTVDLKPLQSKVESTRVALSAPIYSGYYHIVVGCFSVKENAVNLVEKLRSEGHKAQILDEYKGLYRTTISSYASKEEALTALSQVKKEGRPNAWLIRK